MSNTRALCIEPLRYDAALRAQVGAFADVDYVDVGGHDDVVAAVARHAYQVLFVRLGVAIDDAVLAAQPALRMIATPTTGLDHVDLAACARRNVQVISLKGETEFLESVRSTAEHTWALILALSRNLTAAAADVRDGHWRREPFLASELNGKTLGIVGCGRLGRMVAGYGIAFGMTVIAHDTDHSAIARAPRGTSGVSADELLARSDVVSLHLPLEDATRGWLSTDRIARMKRGAWLVNTARGEVADEGAVLAALESGKFGAVGLDVLADDSRWEGVVPAGHAAVRAATGRSNLIITPHVGGYSRESIERTRAFIIDRVRQRIQ